jgi:hypothetical protein
MGSVGGYGVGGRRFNAFLPDTFKFREDQRIHARTSETLGLAGQPFAWIRASTKPGEDQFHLHLPWKRTSVVIESSKMLGESNAHEKESGQAMTGRLFREMGTGLASAASSRLSRCGTAPSAIEPIRPSTILE